MNNRKKGVPMGKIMERVLEYFEGESWQCRREGEGPYVDTGVRLDTGVFDMRVIADDEEEVLGLLISIAMVGPDEARPEVCELLVRANWLLDTGAFQMDFRDGEVQYRTLIDMEGTEPSVAMVRNMVLKGCHAVDFAYPGVMAVLFGGLTPLEAAAQIGAVGEEERLLAMVQ